MTEFPFSLTCDVIIRAGRDTVFRFFTDSELFARWWGKGSTIDARPGGAVRIAYPGTLVARGEVVSVEPGHSISFTYGYEGTAPLIAPGGSLVHIALLDHPEGTAVSLRHDVASSTLRDQHAPGWRYQLALFANVASAVQHSDVAAIADDWFAAWNETEPAARIKLLARCTTEAVAFRDRHSCCVGREELSALIGQVQVHMPNLKLERDGEVRLCQGTALCEWIARGADGAPAATGTNVFQLAPDGRIQDGVGLWR